MGKNRKSSNEQVEQAKLLLATLFPAAFKLAASTEKIPLMIGIDVEVYAKAKPIAPGLSRRILNSTMQRYTMHTSYLKALKEGAARVNIEGKPVGVVTAREAEVAREIAARRKAKTKEGANQQ